MNSSVKESSYTVKSSVQDVYPRLYWQLISSCLQDLADFLVRSFSYLRRYNQENRLYRLFLYHQSFGEV